MIAEFDWWLQMSFIGGLRFNRGELGAMGLIDRQSFITDVLGTISAKITSWYWAFPQIPDSISTYGVLRANEGNN